MHSADPSPRPGQVAFCVLCFMYTAPVAVMIAWAARAQSLRSLVALALAAILLACAFAGAMRTWRRFFLVQAPLSVLGVAFVAYCLIFHMAPGRTMARILAAASLEEVRGFLHFSQGLGLAALLVAWSVLYVGCCLRLRGGKIFSGRVPAMARLVVMALVPITGYAALDPAQLIDGIALDPTVGALMFLGGELPRARGELHGARVTKSAYRASRTGGEEVHVLVVGESARRDSWSAYGYRRPTTPFLDAAGAGTILLLNATADANLTDWAVPILLTGMPPEDFSLDKVRGSVFDLAKEAGYRTAWLVNQDIAISGSVGVAPDLLEFPPDFKANINGRHTFDEELLPSFRKEAARAGVPRFIGLHSMGSHWEYFHRYPPGFQKFGSAADLGKLSMVSVLLDSGASQSAVIDSYDNTVLYTDWLLHQLITSLESQPVPATLLFFPDHGEDLQLLDGATGHGGPDYTRHAFEIPAFVWTNRAYRDAHPEKVAAIRANAAKEIRTHNVFYTEADLMGITWPGFAPAQSFASDKFVPDTTMRHVAGGNLVVRP